MRLEATAKGPASLSNLGPGFDTLGLAISGVSDQVSVARSEGQGIRISSITGVTSDIPLDPKNNCASVAAQAVLDKSDKSFGLDIKIVKGIPLGSGIGGSAASAAAAAVATNHLLEAPFEKEDLVECVLQGEFVASKARHGDNAIPALLGGAISVSSHQADSYRKIPTEDFPSIVILLPQIEIKTSLARDLLPAEVSFKEAIDNASDLSQLLTGLVIRDWELVGKMIMSDRLVEPKRSVLIPGFDSIRIASLDAGALGCALSGSGPAIFALTSGSDAEAVGRTMTHAAGSQGLESHYFVSEIDYNGAVLL